MHDLWCKCRSIINWEYNLWIFLNDDSWTSESMKEILFVTIVPSFANNMILSPSKISFSIDGYFRSWYVEYIFSFYIYLILVFLVVNVGLLFCRILPSIANLSSLQPAWLVYIALLWKQWTAKIILHPSVTLAWDWGRDKLRGSWNTWKYSRTCKNIDALQIYSINVRM